MKKAIMIAVMMFFATNNLSAMTIDAVAKFNTVSNPPIKVRESFGKLPSSGEYGIFLNVECRGGEGEADHDSLFYRLTSGVVLEGKFLYTIIAGKKIMLAEKKWYGWITVDGVHIQYSIERSPHAAFKVWVEVD
ncbi:MAG: hypothetical protein U9P36_14290 [Thermodesulfobacteriota bacterium]|nr:hypothetical protein [Thermodesulfobacteriota bacterium]